MVSHARKTCRITVATGPPGVLLQNRSRNPKSLLNRVTRVISRPPGAPDSRLGLTAFTAALSGFPFLLWVSFTARVLRIGGYDDILTFAGYYLFFHRYPGRSDAGTRRIVSCVPAFLDVSNSGRSPIQDQGFRSLGSRRLLLSALKLGGRSRAYACWGFDINMVIDDGSPGPKTFALSSNSVGSCACKLMQFPHRFGNAR